MNLEILAEVASIFLESEAFGQYGKRKRQVNVCPDHRLKHQRCPDDCPERLGFMQSNTIILHRAEGQKSQKKEHRL